MNEHYIVTIAGGYLKIYAESRLPGQSRHSLDVVESMDFPGPNSGERTGRFEAMERYITSAPRTGAPPGDGDLRWSRQDRRSNLRSIAAELNNFLQNHPGATWDLGVAPILYDSIVAELSPESLRRLKRALPTELTTRSPAALQSHFATARW